MNDLEQFGARDDCGITTIHPAAVERARDRLQTEPVTALAKLFAVVGDPTRLRVLAALRGGELCVCDLAAATGINRSTVSHQLKVLRDHRLVRRRREGKVLFYSVDDHHVEQLLAIGADHVGEMAGAPQVSNLVKPSGSEVAR